MNELLEKNILRYGIIVGIIYEITWVFLSLDRPVMAISNLVICMVFILLLILVPTIKNPNQIALVFHTLVLAGLAYFFSMTGGMAGGTPGFLCAYISFIIMATTGIYLWISLNIFILCLVVFRIFPGLLGMNSFYQPQQITPFDLLIHYLMIAGILMGFTYYFTNKFQYYRKEVGAQFQQLNQVANTLNGINMQLAISEQETRTINDNLESIIEERSHQMEVRSQELTEYAFINAHMLRGPLCRIRGLINLMEKEPDFFPTETLQEVKNLAEHIDGHVKEINSILAPR